MGWTVWELNLSEGWDFLYWSRPALGPIWAPIQ